jgi:hypothetical protein
MVVIIVVGPMINLKLIITALMREAVHTSETSVNSHHCTRRYNPEDSNHKTSSCLGQNVNLENMFT